MELRVEEMARRAGVSVDTVRYYQGRGLLPPPARQGRIAHYGDEHLQRLERIRSLQAQGLSLAAIGRLLSGDLDPRDEPLVAAVAGAGGGSGPVLSLDELARRSGIPHGLLQAAEREGLLSPVGGGYSTADADAARAGLRLLELGLPLPELLDLARRHHEHVRSVAEEAVALFDDHVRRPLRAGPGSPDDDAARRLVEAFKAILPATVALVAHHFERTLLAVATEHIERVGGPDELAAIAAATDPGSAA